MSGLRQGDVRFPSGLSQVYVTSMSKLCQVSVRLCGSLSLYVCQVCDSFVSDLRQVFVYFVSGFCQVIVRICIKRVSGLEA